LFHCFSFCLAYSPGLEYDALIYEQLFTSYRFTCIPIQTWYTSEIERIQIIHSLSLVDVIIGFEDLGTNEMLSYIRNLRDYKTLLVIWIPNLEVYHIKTKNKWYKQTQ
jgi:hypothetical protein